jgi:dynein heavy chain
MHPPTQVNRMLGFALNSKRLKDRLMDTSTLIGEVSARHTSSSSHVFTPASK